jgi:hypothetical protein
MHLGIDRDRVIIGEGLNLTDCSPAQLSELEKLGFEDGGLPAGLRVLLTAGWSRRRQEQGNTDERPDNR